MRRHRAALLVAAAAVGLAGLVAPPAQGADPGAPSVEAVDRLTDDAGVLAVRVSSAGSPVHDVEATFHVGDGTVVVDDFRLVDGTSTDGTWNSARVVLPDLGSYQVDVVATDADGDVSDTSTTWIEYQPVTVVSVVSVGPDRIDPAHRTVTVRGVVQRKDPRTGSLGSAPSGLLVTLQVGSTTDGDAIVAADGSFVVRGDVGPDSGPSVAAVLDVVRDDVYRDLVAEVVVRSWAVHAYPVRFAVDALPKGLDEGERFLVRGSVEFQDDSGWHPYPGAHVVVGSTTNTVVSSSTGAFTARYTAPGGRFTVDVDLALDVSGLTEVRPLHVPGTARRSVTLSWSRYELDEYSGLKFAGSAEDSAGTGLPRGTKLYLERADRSGGPWHTLGWFPVGSYGQFSRDAYSSVPGSYWRISYPGDSAHLPAFSRVVHAARHDTRVTGFDAGPEPVRKGSSVTVRGTLQRKLTSSWTAFSGQRVEVFFRAKGAKRYSYLGTARTSSHGVFSRRFTAKKDGSWTAVWWAPSGAYVDAFSREDSVDVR